MNFIKYCQFIEKDSVIIFKNISINVLYVFFDWLLKKRKNSLDVINFLQTYWNVFCFVRKQKTNYHQIDSFIKNQIHEACQLLLKLKHD